MTNSFKRELGGASKSSSQMGGEAKISLISCGSRTYKCKLKLRTHFERENPDIRLRYLYLYPICIEIERIA
jgi:hypothetical protein